jgi:DNA polymerase-4
VSGLSDLNQIQLTLPFDHRRAFLDGALDGVRDRFGSSAVTRAVLLGHAPALEMPRLPD